MRFWPVLYLLVLGCASSVGAARPTYELRLAAGSSTQLVDRITTASDRVAYQDEVAFRFVELDCDPVWYTCSNVVDGALLPTSSAQRGSWWDPALRLLRVDLRETDTWRLEGELRKLMTSQGPLGE